MKNRIPSQISSVFPGRGLITKIIPFLDRKQIQANERRIVLQIYLKRIVEWLRVKTYDELIKEVPLLKQ